MVNVSLPQVDCKEFSETILETKYVLFVVECFPITNLYFSRCEVVGKTVNTKVCVNVTDTNVEEVCDEIPSNETCFVKDCSPTTRTVLEKSCVPKSDEVCNTVLDENTSEDKCKTITKIEYDEVCESDEPEEKCETTFEYVCEEKEPEIEPYPSHNQVTAYAAPPVTESYYPQYGVAQQGGGFQVKRRRGRIYGQKILRRRRDSETETKSETESWETTEWPVHPGIDPGYTTAYAKPPTSYSYVYESKPEPRVKCDYVPKENCTKVESKENCRQVPKEVPEEVCISVPIQTVRQECRNFTRQECDVISKEVPDEDCQLKKTLLPSMKTCDYVRKPETREVCKTVQMRAFSEECQQVPRLIPKVECDRDMKPVPLEEICVKVDLQLPREECKWETREECR